MSSPRNLISPFDADSPSGSSAEDEIPQNYLVIYLGDMTACVSSTYPEHCERHLVSSCLEECRDYLYFRRNNFRFVLFVMSKIKGGIEEDQTVRNNAEFKIARIGIPLYVVAHETPTFVTLIYSAVETFAENDFLFGINVEQFFIYYYIFHKTKDGFVVTKTYEFTYSEEVSECAKMAIKLKELIKKHKPKEVVLMEHRLGASNPLVRQSIDVQTTFVSKKEEIADDCMYRYLLDLDMKGTFENRLLANQGNAYFQWRYGKKIVGNFKTIGENLPLNKVVKYSKPHNGNFKLYCRSSPSDDWELVPHDRVRKACTNFRTFLIVDIDCNGIITISAEYTLKKRRDQMKGTQSELHPMLLEAGRRRARAVRKRRYVTSFVAVLICFISVFLSTVGILIALRSLKRI